MLLVELRFTHYSPKDSEDGTKEFLIANNLEQAVAYIDETHMYGGLSDMKRDGDEGSFSPDDEWRAGNFETIEKAKAMGLTVDLEYGDIEGSAHDLTVCLCGTYWESVEDAYYGVTHWDWTRQCEISETDARALIALEVAKDIRAFAQKEQS